ncbi:hypothetical protein NDU88_010720 [Pleurodeles waltl]|uniref:Secreted protein n=1 Tax=Pleurodeles waltl TaxID=8319 RepID=A0AAV7RZ12_PLEWA|nr:hypothetical protein NDU88_010720 [Pleurodeles waltl]
MVIALTAIYLVLTKCVRRPELLLTAQCGVLTKCVRRPELLLTAQCGAATQLGNSFIYVNQIKKKKRDTDPNIQDPTMFYISEQGHT